MSTHKGMKFEDLCRQDNSFIDVEKNVGTYLDILNELIKIIDVLEDTPYKQIKKQLLMRFHYQTRVAGSAGIPVKKSILLFVYRKFGRVNTLSEDQERILLAFLQKTPSRNVSGVTVVTVLTAPFPDGQRFSCKHDCFYCPAEPNQPRSYLMQEPAVARANRNEFDARRQTLDRLNTLLMNGHEIDKVEFILEGGTFTEYPAEYLERFIRDLVYTVNTYFDTVETNSIREPTDIVTELRINRDARVRISGICVETRPDVLLYPAGEDERGGDWWIKMFRRWGVTRVQLGVQHTVDHILDGVNRGHDADTASRAIEHLKNQCFKVDIHLMPDLPGTTPEMDKQMFEDVYQGTHFQADQIKVYPCQVVPWTRIEKWYRDGKYLPYAETDWEAFADVVRYAMVECPPWVRMPRVMRDIPMKYISGGKCVPNLRQVVSKMMVERGETTREIRSRECARHDEAIDALQNGSISTIVREYDTRNGRENFLSIETEDEKAIFAFCRLRLPGKVSQMDLLPQTLVFNELRDMALIRELHVYGGVLKVGNKSDGGRHSQHRGFGSKLLKKAEWIAWMNGYRGVAVISGCGVEGYYAKRGYSKIGDFMIKRFWLRLVDAVVISFIMLCYLVAVLFVLL